MVKIKLKLEAKFQSSETENMKIQDNQETSSSHVLFFCRFFRVRFKSPTIVYLVLDNGNWPMKM